MIVEILLIAILAVLLILVYELLIRMKEPRVPDDFNQLVNDVGKSHDGIIAELGKLSATFAERMSQQSEQQKTYQEKVDSSLSGITRTLTGTKRGEGREDGSSGIVDTSNDDNPSFILVASKFLWQPPSKRDGETYARRTVNEGLALSHE